MNRYLRFRLIALSLLGMLASATSALAWETEADLLATLQSQDTSMNDKEIACQQLVVVGTEKAIPVLAKMLESPKLAHYARYGLEPIPSPKVDQVLIAALDTLQGRQLIGVITSIATRGKPAAIDALAKKLDNKDRTVATAAAHAIARLGTPKAAKILGENMTAEFAPACLTCGNTLTKQGNRAGAIAVFVPLSKLTAAPQYVRLAAMLHAVQLQGKDGLTTLTAALKAKDKDLFNMGLRAARLPEVTVGVQAALQAITGASTGRKALLVTLLGDLDDPAGLSTVVDAVSSKDPTVRVAAISALASLGNAEQVKLLVDAATDPTDVVAAEAVKTLAALPGDAVDRAVLALLNDEPRQSIAIQLIGRRRISSAVPKLVALLAGEHQVEAIAALGETVSLKQLDTLAKLLDSDSPKVREAANQAVHAACYRMPDRDATAETLAGYLDGASEQTVQFIMNEMRTVGGPKGLAIVSKAAQGNNPILKEYATRALGEWLDTSAAPVLLALAKSDASGKYSVRGMRGYIRLIRQFAMPEQQRAEMATTALQTASRDAEKKLLLNAIERYPSIEMLRIAVDASKTPSLKTAATTSAMVIVQKLKRRSPAVRALLNQLGLARVKLEIIEAQYGTGSKWKDVTAMLKKRARNLPVIGLPAPTYNASFGGDPVPSTPKLLKIKYRINGKEGQATFHENETIVLPVP